MQSPKKCVKPGKIVASRYMQAAQKVSSKLDISPYDIAHNSQDSYSSRGSRTPISLQSKVKRKDLTSTPNPDASRSELLCDESTIAADQSCMPVLKDSLLSSGIKKKTNVNSSKGDGKATSADNEAKETACCETELDLLYAEYIQAVFLGSRAKKTLKQKSNNALETLHKLWNVNNILRKQEEIYGKECYSLHYLCNVIQYYDEMMALLNMLHEALSSIMPQYSALAASVEVSKSHLCAPDVIYSVEEISSKVAELNKLLQALSTKYEQEKKELARAANLAFQVSELSDDTTAVLEECFKLLTATDLLTMKASSLQIADLQLEE